jgi:hypothetical protein
MKDTVVVHVHNKGYIKYLISGILTGIINTIVFNPYDKAMYNMIKNKNSIFSKINWMNPYSGVWYAIVIRIISYGMYYPLIDFCKLIIKNNNPIFIGIINGSLNALLMNPINVAKYSKWNNKNNTFLQMIQIYGIKILFRSVIYTIFRDIVFSTVHAMLTFKLNPKRDFIKDVLFVSMATIISSPINYFRTQVLSSAFDKPIPSASKIWNDLIQDIRSNVGTNKIIYVLNNRLCIGWATLRVALGMAFSRKCYEYIKKITD